MKLHTIIKSTIISLLFAAFSTAFAADDVKVVEVKDFAAIGKQADSKRLPIMLMFSASGCTYCEKLEEDFLKPMLRSGDYTNKVMIRKLRIDGFGKVRDFEGKQVAASDFADRYSVFVTPTVVFIDGDGVEVAKKRVGLSTPDYYGSYLDQSIDKALDILRRDKPMRVKLTALEKAE
jgi:thioredoxin-related protein